MATKHVDSTMHYTLVARDADGNRITSTGSPHSDQNATIRLAESMLRLTQAYEVEIYPYDLSVRFEQLQPQGKAVWHNSMPTYYPLQGKQ